MLRRAGALTLVTLAGCALIPGVAAATTTCAYSGGYPGDAAPKEQLAGWMAAGATSAGLPGELPVMGAIVESGLTNLSLPVADSAGYFQMRIPIWNQGKYAGFPGNADLQLTWFIDQAVAVNQARVAAGLPPNGADSATWGEWAADVLRPAAQYRHRYQLRLAEANQLVSKGCGVPLSPPPTTTPGPTQQTLDSIKPLLSLGGKRIQDPLARGAVVVEATCPAEACVAQARATLALPGAAKTYRVKSAARLLPRGGKAKLTLRIRASLRRKLRSALEQRSLKAKVTVTARDTAGNSTTSRRIIKLKH